MSMQCRYVFKYLTYLSYATKKKSQHNFQKFCCINQKVDVRKWAQTLIRLESAENRKVV